MFKKLVCIILHVYLWPRLVNISFTPIHSMKRIKFWKLHRRRSISGDLGFSRHVFILLHFIFVTISVGSAKFLVAKQLIPPLSSPHYTILTSQIFAVWDIACLFTPTYRFILYKRWLDIAHWFYSQVRSLNSCFSLGWQNNPPQW